MKRIPRPMFFIVAILILLFSYTAVFGVSYYVGDNEVTVLKGIDDIRWGTDIRGGVEATFRPAGGVDASDEDLNSAKSIIETRMVSTGITDYELYADYNNDYIIVRFPWKADEKDFDVEGALSEISSTAKLTFRPGNSYKSVEVGSDGNPVYKDPDGETADAFELEGKHVKKATDGVDPENGGYIISLEFNKEGAKLFEDITGNNVGKVVSIWMDNVMLSAPNIQEKISGGKAQITGDFTAEEAHALAEKINAGALPFQLEEVSHGSISATLGENSLYAMAVAGIIALILIAIFMIVMYRLPGLIAVIALLGQLGITVASVSGYFPVFSSFTMTLPGIAGLILSIGMGVDANVITSERIIEEMRGGRTLDGALDRGTKSSLTAIIDGNMTIIIVAVILLLVFGPSNVLSIIFGQSTTGTIYAFGYTLLVGVISNFIMGVALSRVMLRSVAGYKWARHKWLFGGAKDGK